MLKKVTASIMLFVSLSYGRGDISAGERGGTYINIAQEISSLVARNIGLKMSVIESTGSIQNIKNMVDKKNIKFAIVQHDILEYLKGLKDINRTLYSFRKNIRVLLPLYFEKLHIIVRRDSDISTFKDIESRKLSIGLRGSGTALTTFLLYKKAFKKNNFDNLNIDRSPLEDALNKLDNKKVDVVFAVGIEPIVDLDRDGQYRLLEIKDEDLISNYYSETIKKGTYPWLNRDVKVVGVASFLICNIKNRVSRLKLIQFGKEFKRRLPYLREVGHPIWKDINNGLLALPKNWKYCSEFKKGWESRFAQVVREENYLQDSLENHSQQDEISKMIKYNSSKYFFNR